MPNRRFIYDIRNSYSVSKITISDITNEHLFRISKILILDSYFLHPEFFFRYGTRNYCVSILAIQNTFQISQILE